MVVVVGCAAMADPTHAGGVVVRASPGGLEVLVVTARLAPDLWVLPKGHLEDDETPEETAVREVAEEAGVEGRVERLLGVVEFENDGEEVRAAYYLMAFVRDVPPLEDRQVAWVTPDEAMRRLRFADVQALVRTATAPRAS